MRPSYFWFSLLSMHDCSTMFRSRNFNYWSHRTTLLSFFLLCSGYSWKRQHFALISHSLLNCCKRVNTVTKWKFSYVILGIVNETFVSTVSYFAKANQFIFPNHRGMDELKPTERKKLSVSLENIKTRPVRCVISCFIPIWFWCRAFAFVIFGHRLFS